MNSRMMHPMEMYCEQDVPVISAMFERLYYEFLSPTNVYHWVALLVVRSAVLCMVISALRLWISREEEYEQLLQNISHTAETSSSSEVREPTKPEDPVQEGPKQKQGKKQEQEQEQGLSPPPPQIKLNLPILDSKFTSNAARVVQATWRGHQQRSINQLRQQASITIQRTARGTIVRNILNGEGLPTLAHALLQEEDAMSRASRTSPVSRDRRFKMAGSKNDPEEGDKEPVVVTDAEKVPKDTASTDSLSSYSSNNNKEFGSKVKAVMEMRMRLLAAIVLQSWFRMVRCRKAYRRIFSSLNTAPINNLLPMGALPAEQQNTREAISFVSSLSSWSSTWNRRQHSSHANVNSKFGILSEPSSPKESLVEYDDSHAFNASPEESQALKNSITYHTSIVQLQSWWRYSLTKVRRGGNGKTLDKTNFAGMGNDDQEEDEDEDDIVKYPKPSNNDNAKRSQRRGTTRNQFYTKLWAETLDKVAKCESMCSDIDVRASVGRLDCRKLDESSVALDDRCEAVFTSTTGEGADGHGNGCYLLPSLCVKSLRHHGKGCFHQKEKAPTGVDTPASVNKDEPRSAVKADGMTSPTLKHSSSIRKKAIRCGDPSLYYVPSSTSAEALPMAFSTNPSSMHAISAPTINTFSSTSNNMTDESFEDHYNMGSRLRCMAGEVGRRGTAKTRINYAFCAHPPVATSVTSNSNDSSRSFSSSAESSASTSSSGSYYSIDDYDGDDDEEAPGKHIDGNTFHDQFVCGAHLVDHAGFTGKGAGDCNDETPFHSCVM